MWNTVCSLEKHAHYQYTCMHATPFLSSHATLNCAIQINPDWNHFWKWIGINPDRKLGSTGILRDAVSSPTWMRNCHHEWTLVSRKFGENMVYPALVTHKVRERESYRGRGGEYYHDQSDYMKIPQDFMILLMTKHWYTDWSIPPLLTTQLCWI